MDDSRAIENLLYTYAERIDRGDFEGVADLFAKGRIAATPAAGDGELAQGREQVLEMYRRSTRIYPDGTPHTQHVTTNAMIEINPGALSGSSRSYYTVLQQVDELPLQPIIAGRYHDTFQKVDGMWWFDKRIIFVDLMGNLSQHLLFDLD